MVVEILEELELGGWKVDFIDGKLLVYGRDLPEELKQKLTQHKDIILSFLRGELTEESGRKEESKEDLFREVFGDGIKILPPREPKTCYACGGTLFWISRLNGRLVCAVCHPPADPKLVAGWRDTKGVTGV